MKTVNMHEAKTHLSSLVDALRTGREKEIVIGLAGRPVARLLPYERAKREFGFDAGRFEIPDDFDEPVPEIIDAFENG